MAGSLPVLETATTELGSAQAAGPFNITLRFVSRTTAAQRQLFIRSAQRWQQIIVRDVPSTRGTIPPNFCGGFGTPQFSGTIDDILVDVLLVPIDGPGNILGAAGPCALRLVDDLPVYGIMFFDTDDLDFFDSLGLLDEIIIHELGHVLGFGTVWDFPRPLLRNVGTRSPSFQGPAALKEWHQLGGRGRVPVEGDFGPGTALAHWDEKTFDNELMTGFINLGQNPLSDVSARSMNDVGYVARPNGDPYRLPSSNLVARSKASGGVNLAKLERLLKPKGAIR